MTKDVKPSELRLLDAAARGEEANFQPEGEEKTDASGGACWGDERSIRAELLSDLCTEAVAANVSARGLRIRGARVCGELNLEAVDIPFPLAFRDCYFERPIALELVRVPSLRFAGSYVPSMYGDQIAVLGNVELTQGFAAGGRCAFRERRSGAC